MINSDVDIRETSVYIVGKDSDCSDLQRFFEQKGFSEVILTVDDGNHNLLGAVTEQTEADRICLIVYFIDDITELRNIHLLTELDNCGILPVVSAEGNDITLILLQKTELKDVEQQPLDFETVFLKIEKMLIRLHMQRRIIDSNRTNREFFLKILRVMNKLLEERDEYTEHHSENVAKIACAIAERYGLKPEDINKLEMAGLLHDFGKIGITDKILNKPGRLTNEEYEVIKKHPSIAQVILEPVSDLKDIIPWIKYHHEKWDGTGYPDGLAGEDIPLAARILAVADAYDTMASKRTYHDPFSDEYILNELVTWKNKQFDPDIVDVFLDILEDKALELIT